MTHSYGCGSLLIQPFLLGATLVDGKFEPKAASPDGRERVTLQLAAPAHYILELDHPERQSHDLCCLRRAHRRTDGAGRLIQRCRRNGVYITSFWGASEVGQVWDPLPLPFNARDPREVHRVPVAAPRSACRSRDPGELPDGTQGALPLGLARDEGLLGQPEETPGRSKTAGSTWDSSPGEGATSASSQDQGPDQQGRVQGLRLRARVAPRGPPEGKGGQRRGPPNRYSGEHLRLHRPLEGEALTLAEIRGFWREGSPLQAAGRIVRMGSASPLSGG